LLPQNIAHLTSILNTISLLSTHLFYFRIHHYLILQPMLTHVDWLACAYDRVGLPMLNSQKKKTHASATLIEGLLDELIKDLNK